MQLGFAPLLEAGVDRRRHLIADCKSGVSGAGRKAELGLLFSEASDNFKAYSVKGHRHHPETVEQLARLTAQPIGLVFTPHLVPMIRGMHSTLYAELTRDDVDLQALFERRYAGEPFVDVLPPGSMPDTRSVRGSNALRIAVHRPPGSDLVTLLVVQDNLVKGASGQAVQCMNLMFGLPENRGLAALARPALSERLTPAGLWRRARQHFSIDAPRMAVRSHLPWPWKAVLGVVLLVVIGGMWWWGFDFGQIFGGFNRKEVEARVATLEEEVGRLRAESAELRTRASQLDSELAMSRGAQASLTRQAAELQGENSQLKEEVVFLQQLFADANKQAGIAIQRVAVERERPRHLPLQPAGRPRRQAEGRLRRQPDAAGRAAGRPGAGSRGDAAAARRAAGRRRDAEAQIQVLSAD